MSRKTFPLAVRLFAHLGLLWAVLSGCSVAAQDAQPVASMVTTEPGIQVQVLDWGGTGPPLMLLAGMDATAKDFDNQFVQGLERTFHVYSMTRRGFGASSAPVPDATNYSADRLGDDVLAVLDHLQLQKPLLVGHSLAGEELSSVGSRHPGRVAGLVYLDAGYRYALSGPGLNDIQLDAISMRRDLAHALNDIDPLDRKQAADAFLRELPDFEKELRAYSNALADAVPLAPSERQKEEGYRKTPAGRAEMAILDQEQRYNAITCPVLVIFAYPHALPSSTPEDVRKAREKSDMDFVDQRVRLFKALPDATMLLLPHASHEVQASRRDEVLKAIDQFATRVQSNTR